MESKACDDRQRPVLRCSECTAEALSLWRSSGGSTSGVPCPTGGFVGKRLWVFWDLDNCRLLPRVSCPTGSLSLVDLQQHCDLLTSVFCGACGVAARDFRIYVFVAKVGLPWVAQPDGLVATGGVLARQSPYVHVVTSPGKRAAEYIAAQQCAAARGGGAGGAEGAGAGAASDPQAAVGPRAAAGPQAAADPQAGVHLDDYVADGQLNAKFREYIQSVASKGDVAVLISSDSDFLPIVREAVPWHGLQVLQLYDIRKVAKMWLRAEGRDLVAWAVPWMDFLKRHCASGLHLIRPPGLALEERRRRVLLQSLAIERAFWADRSRGVNIVVLLPQRLALLVQPPNSKSGQEFGLQGDGGGAAARDGSGNTGTNRGGGCGVPLGQVFQVLLADELRARYPASEGRVSLTIRMLRDRETTDARRIALLLATAAAESPPQALNLIYHILPAQAPSTTTGCGAQVPGVTAAAGAAASAAPHPTGAAAVRQAADRPPSRTCTNEHAVPGVRSRMQQQRTGSSPPPPPADPETAAAAAASWWTAEERLALGHAIARLRDEAGFRRYTVLTPAQGQATPAPQLVGPGRCSPGRCADTCPPASKGVCTGTITSTPAPAPALSAEGFVAVLQGCLANSANPETNTPPPGPTTAVRSSDGHGSSAGRGWVCCETYEDTAGCGEGLLHALIGSTLRTVSTALAASATSSGPSSTNNRTKACSSAPPLQLSPAAPCGLFGPAAWLSSADSVAAAAACACPLLADLGVPQLLPADNKRTSSGVGGGINPPCDHRADCLPAGPVAVGQQCACRRRSAVSGRGGGQGGVSGRQQPTYGTWVEQHGAAFFALVWSGLISSGGAYRADLRWLQPPTSLGDLVWRLDCRDGYLDAPPAADVPVVDLQVCGLPLLGRGVGQDTDSGEDTGRVYLALDTRSRELKVLKDPLTTSASTYPPATKQAASELLTQPLSPPTSMSMPHLAVRQRLAVQTVVAFLADQFTADLAAAATATVVTVGGRPAAEPRLVVLRPAVVLCGVGREGKWRRYRLLEPFVLGRRRLFTGSRNGLVAPPEDHLPIIDAFCHWTCHKTGGRMVVTDLRGWYDKDRNTVRLTDPVVHCTEFGLLDEPANNRWLSGMEEFFQGHYCGPTCRALGLHRDCEPQQELARIRERMAAELGVKL